MKRIVILGSTGSIGESTLRVVEAHRDELSVAGLVAGRQWEQVLAQAAAFGVAHVALADPAAAAAAQAAAPATVRVHAGEAGIETLIGAAGADVVVCAVVGMAGLRPVLAAVETGADIALANKESLVAAGHLVTARARARGARLLPVDSEHSAMFQCLQSAANREGVARLWLTASGGPFAGRPELDLRTVRPADALAHPRWRMGPKVTIDSATLMNKGLEIIEARWLFDMAPDRIRVLIHPQSIVHSLVEFDDGAWLAQLSEPDMRFAIQYALLYPRRAAGGLPLLDLAAAGRLDFTEPDMQRFPALRLARAAAATGGTLATVLNAANEVAVESFLAGRAGFCDIWHTVERVMAEHTPQSEPPLAAILEADRWARRRARELVAA